MINCVDLRETLSKTIGDAFRCVAFDERTLRVFTPFAYPNGDIIDIYLIQQANGIVATDYGETLRYLSSINVSVQDGKRYAQFVEFLKIAGVRNTRGNLVIDVTSGIDAASILRLCEAIVRVADLGISSRQRSIIGEFDAILKPKLRQIAGNLSIVEGPEFYGLSGEVYELGFEIQRLHRPEGLVLATLTAKDSSSANDTVDEVVRAWDDLKRVIEPDRRVTVFDTRDSHVVWKEQWLNQVARHSKVVLFDDIEVVADLLVA